MGIAVSAQQLAVHFGRRAKGVMALQPLDLAIDQGRIVGILGPNGSGKTTLLRVLAGLLPPSAGRASVFGLPVGSPALRTRIGYQADGPLPIGVLSAIDWLRLAGAELGLANATVDARAEALLERLELAHTGKRWLGTFSTGMQKRLALATALLGEPDLLLLDEPTAGLDPLGSATVMAILRERAAAGTTVLFASHHLLEVEEVCDEAVVLQDGVLRARGTLDELLGTGAAALVVRGLDAERLQQLGTAATTLGGEVVRIDRERTHLFALFRRFARPGAGGERT